MNTPRSDRWCGLVCLVVLMAVTVGAVLAYHTPRRWRVVEEDGLIETLSALCYLAAAAWCVAALWRSRHDPLGAGWWPVLLGLCLFCAYREVGPEPDALRLHAFSWKYLFDAQYDLGVRVFLFLASAGLVVAVGAHVVRSRARLAQIVRRDGVGWPGALVIGGLALLAGAQLWDKFPQLQQLDPTEYAEEWIEGIGALAILLGVAQRYRRWRRDRLGLSRVSVLADVAVILLVFVFGASGLSAVQWYRSPIAGIATVDAGVLVTSGQPRPPDLRRMRERYGIRSVIRVGPATGDPAQQREDYWCELSGVPLVHLADGPAGVRQFLDVVGDARSRPVMVHDRTGYGPVMRYVALYKVVFKGQTPVQACRETERIAGRYLARDILTWLARYRAVYRDHLRLRSPTTRPSSGPPPGVDR